VSEGIEYALLKVRKEQREKYAGHAYVGVPLARVSKRGRTHQQTLEVQMMEHLFKTRRRIRSGVMFTEAAPETIEYIKHAYTVRVTRNKGMIL
jgi:hypothetical protein